VGLVRCPRFLRQESYVICDLCFNKKLDVQFLASVVSSGGSSLVSFVDSQKVDRGMWGPTWRRPLAETGWSLITEQVGSFFRQPYAPVASMLASAASLCTSSNDYDSSVSSCGSFSRACSQTWTPLVVPRTYFAHGLVLLYFRSAFSFLFGIAQQQYLV